MQQAINIQPALTLAPTNGSETPASPPTAQVAMVAETALPLALTVQESSQILRLDPRTIRAKVRSGELGGNQRGHTIRVSRSSVLEWLRGKRRVPRSKR